MIYLKQDRDNPIVLHNVEGLETGERFKAEFLNDQFGSKELHLVSTMGNSRYLEGLVHVVSDRADEDLLHARVWLPTGFSRLVVGTFDDKVFVEFKPKDEFVLVKEAKKFVLE